MNDTIDTTRLTLLLNELRLPAIWHLWSQFTERSDKEGWPASRLLMGLEPNVTGAASSAISRRRSGFPRKRPITLTSR